MTLQELNEYIQDIIADPELQETCRFELYENDTSDPDHIQLQGTDYEVNYGVYFDQYGTLVFRLYGGLNGGGNWVDYLNGILDVISDLEKLPEVEYAYIIDITNDAMDDIFDCIIGIHPTNKGDFEE